MYAPKNAPKNAPRLMFMNIQRVLQNIKKHHVKHGVINIYSRK